MQNCKGAQSCQLGNTASMQLHLQYSFGEQFVRIYTTLTILFYDRRGVSQNHFNGGHKIDLQ